MSRKETLILLTLASINFTQILDFMIMMPLGPQLMRVMEISPQQFSVVVSSYTIVAGISGFLAAFYLDLVDRKKTLIVLYVGFVVGTFLCGLAPSYGWLVAARGFTGAFAGILAAMVLSLVGDLIPMEKRARAMGIVMAGFSAAAALGVPFGLYFATDYGWHVPFIAVGIIGVGLTALIITIIPSVKKEEQPADHHKPSVFDGIKYVFTDNNQLFALLFIMLLLFGQFSMIPFISPYMVANVGFSEKQLTYIYLIGGSLTVFSSPLIGRWADKIGKVKVFTLFMVLSLIPTFAITNMVPGPIYIPLIFTSMFFVFISGRMIPATATVISTAHPSHRGTFMSIKSSVQMLSAGISAYIAGLVVVEAPDKTLLHYDWVGYLAIGMSLLSFFVIKKIKVKY